MLYEKDMHSEYCVACSKMKFFDTSGTFYTFQATIQNLNSKFYFYVVLEPSKVVQPFLNTIKARTISLVSC